MKVLISAILIWLIGSYVAVRYGLGIGDEYLPVLTSIMFLYGVILGLIHQSIRKKGIYWTRRSISQVAALVACLFILSAATYLILPFRYTLSIKNEKGDGVASKIRIIGSDGEIAFAGYTNLVNISLWKGTYSVEIESQGYVRQSLLVNNPLSLSRNQDITRTVILETKLILLSEFSFFDPTQTIQIEPRISVIGRNILGDYVSEVLSKDDKLLYGVYDISIADEHFAGDATIIGDAAFFEGKNVTELALKPNERYQRISRYEVGLMLNYLADFMDLSVLGFINETEKGLPRQFYLYKKDEMVSLGKLLFIYCQHMAYEEEGTENRTYFMPHSERYFLEQGVRDPTECYRIGLDGGIPESIGNKKISEHIYNELVGPGRFDHEPRELNQVFRGVDVAFTFDIESGRYVFARSDIAISPCENENYSSGLANDEIVCDDPAYVAWMSPIGGNVTYTQYSYPQVSGILGYREILSFMERYGIPTTNYIVKKDILAFEKLEPDLIERTRMLIDKGVYEVGAHSRYHTNLGLVTEEIARRDVIESRKFLTDYFDTDVPGFRAPYQSLVGNDNDKHIKALEDGRYEYYSQVVQYFGKHEDSDIVHRKYNAQLSNPYSSFQAPHEFLALMHRAPYVITLDHPWNIPYQEGLMLYEDPNIKYNLRAVVLTAINNGGVMSKVKDVRMNMPDGPSDAWWGK